MTNYISNENKDKIIDKFGNDFYERVQNTLESCVAKWHIDDLKLINSFSANLVFEGISEIFGPVVMKFGRNHEEFSSEVNALKNLKSHTVCQLYDVDNANIVLLQEAIVPGMTLQQEKNIDVRLDEFCSLFKQLHLVADNTKISNDLNDSKYNFKSYKDWIFKIKNYMDRQEDWHEVAIHMSKAKDLFVELSKDYSSDHLLHGDFHYYNILKGEKGYKVIDPKGVIGHPIFDLPRYILNEFWDEEDDSKVDTTTEKVISVIGKNLDIAEELLVKLLYIEGVMAMCWNVEDGMAIDEKEASLVTINRLANYLSNDYNI